MMARNLLESIRLLSEREPAVRRQVHRRHRGQRGALPQYAESSPSIGTSLNPYIGYEKAAEVIKESVKTGRSIRELVLEAGLMTDEELDRALDVLAMTGGWHRDASDVDAGRVVRRQARVEPSAGVPA